MSAEVRGLDEYQAEAARTGRDWDALEHDYHRMLLCLGLAGEGGEVFERVKKEVGHGLPRSADRVAEELGDTLWYLSELARVHGVLLSEVASRNVEKLRARYPRGFEPGLSVDVSREARRPAASAACDHDFPQRDGRCAGCNQIPEVRRG